MTKQFPSDEQLKRKCGWKEIPRAGVITRAGSAMQNKTGSWRAFRPVIDESKCINCGLCCVNCPEGTIPFREGKRGKVDLDFCKGCGICAQVCPVKAIKMKEEAGFKE